MSSGPAPWGCDRLRLPPDAGSGQPQRKMTARRRD